MKQPSILRRQRRCLAPWLGSGALKGLLLAGLVVAPAQAQAPSPPQIAQAARPTDARPAAPSLDQRIRRLEDSVGSLDERLRRDGDPRASLGIDRLALALLHLETVVGSGRPWPREWRLIIALDGAAVLPPLYLEVLGSHASRGVPTNRDLTDRFEALAPAIAARASSDAAWVDRGMTLVRSTLSGFGLVAPVEPGQLDTALAGIREQLRRGELPAALAEAALLPEEQQALLAGWLAQLRARVAVEQALQEVILGLLAGRAGQG